MLIGFEPIECQDWTRGWMTSNETRPLVEERKHLGQRVDPVQQVDMFENSKDPRRFDGHRLDRNQGTIQ